MILLSATIFISAIVSVISNDDISGQFNYTQIVPDVLKIGPKELLKVNFNGRPIKEFGEELTPTEVKSAPSLQWNADPKSFYTVAMTDPDAPSRREPKAREFLHWLVVNIPGNDIGRGDTMAAYVGSGPPKGTALHRYVLLVYKQPFGKIDISGEKRISHNKRDGRPEFSIQKYADRHRLGPPIAGNMYEAQWDEYVINIHRQLSRMDSFNV